MKTAIALLLLTASAVVASVVVLVKPGPDRRVVALISSADTLAYLGNTNAFINPVITNAATLLRSRWTNSAFVEIPQAEFDAEATAAAAAERTNSMSSAIGLLNETNDIGRVQRAIYLLTLDQINRLRQSNGLSIITTQQFINSVSNAIRQDPK